MNRPMIKLCGFQTTSDVKKAVSLDIDAIGFILVPGRKRTVDMTVLKDMLAIVPTQLIKVGVMMEPTFDEITAWLKETSLSAIQLHGEESPDFCQRVKQAFPAVQLIKTIHMQHGARPGMLRPFLPWIDVVLLDSTFAGQKGGTGKVFDWSQIPLFTSYLAEVKMPLWIAGGITPQNVQSLVETYHPDGIDVSSGIESDGVKDMMKMQQFVERVRRSDKVC